jgi:hypothetical protein
MTTQRNLNLVWASNGGTSDPSDAKYTLGWEVEIPSFQNFNFVLNNNSRNILVGAEQRHHNWENSISYVSGARVLGSDGTYYTCIEGNIGNDPTTDEINNYWITGDFISAGVSDDGVAKLTPEQEHGFLLENMGLSSASDTWTTNDLTISNSSAFIGLYNKVAESDNLVLGNSRGELVVFNAGQTTSPDGRSVLPNNANVHRVYHEGNKPVIGDVTGGVEEAPNDGKYYARKNKTWLQVTSTTVSNELPPALLGSGQGWFNLADGHLYIDIEDGDSSQWVPANPPQVILSGEAPEGYVEEAPEDGKQYARKDANWVEAESGGMSSFKMQDATDAELNIDLVTSTYTYENAVPTGNGDAGPAGSSLLCWKYDAEGNELPLALNGTIVRVVVNGGTFDYDKVLSVTNNDENTVTLSWPGMTMVPGWEFKIFHLGELPLIGGDAWVYNEADGKFKPTQLSSLPKGKMEDATDAELNILTNIDVSFNTISSSPQSGDGRYYQPVTPGPMVCSKVDSNGVTVDAEVFNNQLCNIYYGSSITPSATEVVTTTVQTNTIKFYFNDVSLVSGGFRIETVNTVSQPLQDGDVWQYDSTREKFLPTQINTSPTTPTQIVNGGGSVVLNETGQLSINATNLNLATSKAGHFSSYLGVGGSYIMVAGDADTAQGQNSAGSISLRAGSSDYDDAGNVLIEGGSCSVVNTGSPSSPFGRSGGGSVRVEGGRGTETTTDGGSISFEAGRAIEGNGGPAFLKGGSNTSSTAKAGTLYLQAGVNTTDESLSGEVHIAGGGTANSYINLKHDVIQVISPELNLENTTVEGGDASFSTLISTILGTDTYDLPMDSPEEGQVLVAKSSSETDWETPKPSVATVVVTEFPETPEPNTLYIKKDI